MNHPRLKKQLKTLHFFMCEVTQTAALCISVCACVYTQRLLYSSQTVDVLIGVRRFQKHAGALCHCRKEGDRNNK